jgi:hypothetical protein
MPPSQQIPRRQWYIRVEVAITEFCGRSQDYFSRVKAADKNKSFRKPSWLSDPLPWADKPIHFMGFSELMPCLGKI